MASTEVHAERFANLYLVRHGESTCNTVYRIAGICDVPLNGLGRAQAEKAGRIWNAGTFDLVFVSPLRRAQQTAETACATMDPRPEFAVDPRLAERDFGSYTLQNKAILQRRHGVVEYERAMNDDSATMTGGEPIEEFRRRVTAFYEETLLPALEDGKRVLVVSHKYVIEFLSRLILGLPLTGAYDLRLPNSQFLCAAELDRYVAHEVKWRNEFYDALTVNYHLVFMVAAAVGLLLHVVGVQTEVSPYILIAILAAATAIGFTTVEIEEVSHYLQRRDIIIVNLWRFVAAPVGLAAIAYFAGVLATPMVLACLAFVAAPAGVVSVTASRCAGGLILPALATVMISTVVTVVPFGILLGSGAPREIPGFILVCLLLFAVTVFAPFAIVLVLRARWPIRTAKFGTRNGHLAVLLMALYILLAMLNIDLDSALTAGLAATGLALAIKAAMTFLIKRDGLFAVDYFSAMTYPNVFILVVVGEILDLPFLAHMATWYLIPMSLLAVADGAFAHACAERADPARLRQLLLGRAI